MTYKVINEHRLDSLLGLLFCDDAVSRMFSGFCKTSVHLCPTLIDNKQVHVEHVEFATDVLNKPVDK